MVIFCSTFAFSGCKLFSKKQDRAIAKFTVYYSDDSSEKYEGYSTDLDFSRVSVPYHPEGRYSFEYEVYYIDSKKVIQRGEILWTVKASDIKEHQVTKHVGVEGKLQLFGIILVVEDTRITPTIVLDPNGAIEYTQNERYVYKYDRQSHLTSVIYTNLPKAMYCTYGDKIIYFESFSIWLNGRTILSLTEIGVYEIRYTVLASKYIDEKDKLYCTPTNLYITVEIIE